MSNLEKLLEKGAQVVGGDLVLRHKLMGQFRNGDFIVTPEGMAELEIVDVEVEVKPTRRSRKAAEEATPAAPAAVDDVTIDV